MQTDRELLELAAKAIGAIGFAYLDDDKVGAIALEGKAPINWNPLTDDGDALRLVEQLEIAVLPGCRAQIGHPYGAIFGEDALTVGATRRAIVRAAAAIGAGKE